MVTDRNKYIWHIDCFLAFHNDRIFSYLHFSFGLIHPFHTEQLHLDLIEPQLPCSPCMTVPYFSIVYTERKPSAAMLSLQFSPLPSSFSTRLNPPEDSAPPWTFSPCCPWRTALARQGAAWSWGKWPVHAGSCPVLTSHHLLCPHSHLHFAYPSCGSTCCP